MSTKTGPLKLTAIVFSAKGLKPKKKDKHKFSVIIGVGQHNKFRTEIVEDLFGNPAFNTECEITVDDPSLPLTFLVTEKHDKDILGQVILPLGDLMTFRTNRPMRAPLQPHKKCPRPEGEILYEAWISSGSVAAATVSPLLGAVSTDDTDSVHRVSFPSGLKKLRDKLSHSPMLTRKSSGKEHKRTNSDGLFPLKPNTSMSCHDLTSLNSYGDSGPRLGTGPRLSVVSAADSNSIDSFDINSQTETVKELMVKPPEVTGISPKEGPSEGGTKLTIRGSNLGCNKDDVVGLYICGSNVLSTLEYFSSSKLICTTKAHRPCAGTVAVETQSGGRGVSLVQFSFVAIATAVDLTSDTTSEASSSLSRSSSRGDADMKRDASLKGHCDREAGTGSLLKAGTKARSMFDLSLPAVALKPAGSEVRPAVSEVRPAGSEVRPAGPEVRPTGLTMRPAGPEVSGVSPCDGPSTQATRLRLRGCNLGRSKADIVSVTVAGIDCTASVEYESASCLVCLAGPSPGGTTSGDIIVETKSGGVGVSNVKFRFIDPLPQPSVAVDDSDDWAAVPYDATSDISSNTVTADESRHSPLTGVTGRQLAAPVSKQPPPIVEIQPMSRRVMPSSPHRKGPAPPTPTQRVEQLGTTTAVYQLQEANDADSQVIIGTVNKSSLTTVDHSLTDKITELTNNLLMSEDQVKRLQQENKALREENERMRQYMECLVSKAISTCPQILCVDTSKFL